MNLRKQKTLVLLTSLALLMTGCASSSIQSKPSLIPPLPSGVLEQAHSSQSMSAEVQSWLVDVQQSLTEASQP